MKELIAYCGLDCEKCEARIATLNNDNALREKVSKLWSELNGVDIKPEMINCEGCRVDGVKTYFCDNLCTVRKCALGKGHLSCSDCAEMGNCSVLSEILLNNAEAEGNLRGK